MMMCVSFGKSPFAERQSLPSPKVTLQPKISGVLLLVADRTPHVVGATSGAAREKTTHGIPA